MTGLWLGALGAVLLLAGYGTGYGHAMRLHQRKRDAKGRFVK